MYSVGILATGDKWSETLAGLAEASGSTVSGWINPLTVRPDDTGHLIDRSDLIWIPEKLNPAMDEAIAVIRHSRHLSLGFPVSDFSDQAENLVKLAHEARVQVQVGHSERHRPVFRSTLDWICRPQHIRVHHHLTGFQSEENSHLIFDEILADLDLVLGLMGSSVRKVRTHVSYLQGERLFQIDNRTEFHNGSMISLAIREGMSEPVREIEIIQGSGVIRIDLTAGTSQMSTYSNGTWDHRLLWPPAGSDCTGRPDECRKDEERARQCISFIHTLEKNLPPLSSLEEGYSALEIARQIATTAGRF